MTALGLLMGGNLKIPYGIADFKTVRVHRGGASLMKNLSKTFGAWLDGIGGIW